MMRGTASLHADQARRQRSEEPQHLSSAQLLAHQYLSCRINAVNLEDVLRKVQPDRGNLLHGRFPLMSSRSTTSSWHADAAAGAVHPISFNVTAARGRLPTTERSRRSR